MSVKDHESEPKQPEESVREAEDVENEENEEEDVVVRGYIGKSYIVIVIVSAPFAEGSRNEGALFAVGIFARAAQLRAVAISVRRVKSISFIGYLSAEVIARVGTRRGVNRLVEFGIRKGK